MCIIDIKDDLPRLYALGSYTADHALKNLDFIDVCLQGLSKDLLIHSIIRIWPCILIVPSAV